LDERCNEKAKAINSPIKPTLFHHAAFLSERDFRLGLPSTASGFDGTWGRPPP
jgi:hypothetical protein